MDDIDIATDAALVGTEEAQEEMDPETHTKTITHKKIYGKLNDADVLHYDEGQMLIKRGTYAENTLALFQKALNPIGSGLNKITKNLAHQEIAVEPKCSLLITSHEIENLLETVLNTGFFQRIVLYPRYVSINERKMNEMLRAGRFGKRLFTEIDVETIGKKLMETAKANENFEVKVNENVYPIARQAVDNKYKLIETAHERVREIMATFVPRYDNLMYIFAVHNCCANMKKEVDVADIKYGADLSYVLFREVMSWVEENISITKFNSKEQSYLNTMYQIFKLMDKNEGGYVYLTSFVSNCSSRFKISPPTVLRKIEFFKGFGKIKEMNENNTKLIKIEI
jgi:hypothetical protein